MGYELRDVQATHIADPTIVTLSGALLATSDGENLNTNFTNISTAINAILVAIENVGNVAKA